MRGRVLQEVNKEGVGVRIRRGESRGLGDISGRGIGNNKGGGGGVRGDK